VGLNIQDSLERCDGGLSPSGSIRRKEGIVRVLVLHFRYCSSYPGKGANIFFPSPTQDHASNGGNENPEIVILMGNNHWVWFCCLSGLV